MLLQVAQDTIRKMSTHKVSCHSPVIWSDIVDIDFVYWLTKEIVLLDPKDNCIITGKETDWIGLDKNKSMFNTEDGYGLPIGNLTS